MHEIFKSYSPTFIIAEIGVNHNGDIDLAKRLIDEEKSCGADAVKLQTFTARSLAAIDTPKITVQEMCKEMVGNDLQEAKKNILLRKNNFPVYISKE